MASLGPGGKRVTTHTAGARPGDWLTRHTLAASVKSITVKSVTKLVYWVGGNVVA
jgi:hypothetical protein